MRLDQLHIQNFRCYEDATFDFQPGFNLVVGVNGSGKTSLLQAVAASFNNFANSIKGGGNISDQDVRFFIHSYEDRLRFEQAYPLKLSAKGEAFGKDAWQISKERNGASASVDIFTNVEMNKKLELIDSGTEFNLPIFVVYKANRRWVPSGTSPERSARERASRLDGYLNWFDAASNAKDFESWFIGKTLERLQRMSKSKIPNKFNDELEWVNQAIRHALPKSLGIEYSLELRELVVNLDGDTFLTFSSLSDGQRGMVTLIADIARRMCLLNPQMGTSVLKNTTGIVVIDELDIHLHPAWQRKIVTTLKNAFPKVQFIAASHSPQIIGGLTPGEVILLNNGNASHPRVTYGLDSSRVLEEVMGTSEREPEIEQLLSQLFGTIEDNDLEKAKVQLQSLKEKAPDLPEFAGAQALIRRKEILGK